MYVDATTTQPCATWRTPSDYDRHYGREGGRKIPHHTHTMAHLHHLHTCTTFFTRTAPHCHHLPLASRFCAADGSVGLKNDVLVSGGCLPHTYPYPQSDAPLRAAYVAAHTTFTHLRAHARTRTHTLRTRTLPPFGFTTHICGFLTSLHHLHCNLTLPLLEERVLISSSSCACVSSPALQPLIPLTIPHVCHIYLLDWAGHCLHRAHGFWFRLPGSAAHLRRCVHTYRRRTRTFRALNAVLYLPRAARHCTTHCCALCAPRSLAPPPRTRGTTAPRFRFAAPHCCAVARACTTRFCAFPRLRFACLSPACALLRTKKKKRSKCSVLI